MRGQAGGQTPAARTGSVGGVPEVRSVAAVSRCAGSAVSKHGPPARRSIGGGVSNRGRTALDQLHDSSACVCMRTTLNLDGELVDQARRLTGIREKTALLHAGLEALISQASARRLATLGGTERALRAPRRRRPRPRS
jgi:hypothetical protein